MDEDRDEARASASRPSRTHAFALELAHELLALRRELAEAQAAVKSLLRPDEDAFSSGAVDIVYGMPAVALIRAKIHAVRERSKVYRNTRRHMRAIRAKLRAAREAGIRPW